MGVGRGVICHAWKAPLRSLLVRCLFPLATDVQKPPQNASVFFFVDCANLEGF